MILQAFAERVRSLVSARSRGIEDEGKAVSDRLPDVETLFRKGLDGLRGNDLELAAALFGQVLAEAPDFIQAWEARGEALDRAGREAEAAACFEQGRALRRRLGFSPPDRSHAVRLRGRFPLEVDGYGRVAYYIKGVMPLIGRGNAHLAAGRAELALADYEAAAQAVSDLPGLAVLKGEALCALRRHEEAAVEFSRALSIDDTHVDALSGRAIAHLALGRYEAALADWRRQLDLVDSQAAAVRGCIALRLADYSLAEQQFGRAAAQDRHQPYWQLYRATAALRAIGNAGAISVAGEGWPMPLLALLDGQASEQQVLRDADTPGRRVEAAFQLAVVALAREKNKASAARWLVEVVETAPPHFIEHATARAELLRLES